MKKTCLFLIIIIASFISFLNADDVIDKNPEIRVLVINANRRKSGNVNTLAKSFFKGVEEKGAICETIKLFELNIPSWAMSDYTLQDQSIVKVQNIYNNLSTVDIIVIASPINSASLPAQLKAFMEHAYGIYHEKASRKKSFREKVADGYFLAVQESDDESNLVNAKNEILAFYQLIDVYYKGEILCFNYKKNADINNIKDILYAGYKLGKEAVENYRENNNLKK